MKFEKGKSGNPGGRPKSKELRELCRTYTEDAVKELGRLALKAKGQMTRVVAIRELLDRAYGRPMQAIDVVHDDAQPAHEQQRKLTPPEVEAGIGALLAQAGKDLGIAPIEGLPNDQRAKRLLEQDKPIQPYLYRALAQVGTLH
jgi:hypothetical protein